MQERRELKGLRNTLATQEDPPTQEHPQPTGPTQEAQVQQKGKACEQRPGGKQAKGAMTWTMDSPRGMNFFTLETR